MSQVIDIAKKAQEATKKSRDRKLDAEASYVALEQCLKTIEMNSMPELRNIKAMMSRTMKDMRDIGNGKKTSKR